MIYDCIIYNGEQELLEIRLNEMSLCDTWVTHIIVEADKTFTGLDKLLYFNEKKELFSKYQNIMYLVVDDMPMDCDSWGREKHQRNEIMKALKFNQPNYNDVILISDADEIPRAKQVNKFLTSGIPFAALILDKYSYYLNCLEGRQSWNRSRIMTWEYLKDKTPEEVRNSGYDFSISDAGWHWSYLGGVDAIRNKLNSFSHQEVNTPELNNYEVLLNKIETGQSLWTNDPTDLWKFIQIDLSHPEYLLKTLKNSNILHMRYFDCFTFFNEFELLKLRCEELKSLDTTHILVESPFTHTGDPKPKYFQERAREFEEYDIVSISTHLPNNGDAWANENAQRDAISSALLMTWAEDSDVIGIFDADEIPKAEMVARYKPEMGIVGVKMDKMSYYLNCVEGYQQWEVGRLCTYEMLKKTTPNKLRNEHFNTVMCEAGWHFAWLGGYDRMIQKLDAFAHQESNTSALRDVLKIKYETGESLWGDDYWRFVKIDDTFPKYLKDNQEEFKHLIKKI
jgi:beta-1,4-mannosyl-glycoprotein beta-1,4-N-acetylglucosaminyltransferase